MPFVCKANRWLMLICQNIFGAQKTSRPTQFENSELRTLLVAVKMPVWHPWVEIKDCQVIPPSKRNSIIN